MKKVLEPIWSHSKLLFDENCFEVFNFISSTSAKETQSWQITNAGTDRWILVFTGEILINALLSMTNDYNNS